MEQLEFFFGTSALLFICRFNRHMSHYAFRAQIMSYCSSLRALLEDFPVIKDTFFMMGQAQDKKGPRDFKEDLKADPRCVMPFRVCCCALPLHRKSGLKFSMKTFAVTA